MCHISSEYSSTGSTPPPPTGSLTAEWRHVQTSHVLLLPHATTHFKIRVDHTLARNREGQSYHRSVTRPWLCGFGCTGSCHQQVVVNEGLAAAKKAGAAGADAPDGGQVGMMEDRQLHRETSPHAGNDKHYTPSHVVTESCYHGNQTQGRQAEFISL